MRIDLTGSIFSCSCTRILWISFVSRFPIKNFILEADMCCGGAELVLSPDFLIVNKREDVGKQLSRCVGNDNCSLELNRKNDFFCRLVVDLLTKKGV